MRRVIRGQRYDSETAIKVCEIWEGYRGDFTHLDCSLYQKKVSKEFFLAGFGGAMTIFSSKTPDGNYIGDEKILPISESEARAFIEKYSPGQIEKFFPATQD